MGDVNGHEIHVVFSSQLRSWLVNYEFHDIDTVERRGPVTTRSKELVSTSKILYY
jgi:hypothetical protein